MLRRLLAATAIAAATLVPTPTAAEAPQATALSCFMWTNGGSYFYLRCTSGPKVDVVGSAQCWTQNSRTQPGRYRWTAYTTRTSPGGPTVYGFCADGLKARFLRWYAT